MNCKRLTAYLKQKLHGIAVITKGNGITLIEKSNDYSLKQNGYGSKEIVHKYGVKYCVRYRPLGLLEWILARGWWNDKGVWTEDGIFNDGKI